MWQRFTENLRRVVYYSQVEAEQQDVLQVTPEHLLLGLLREDGVALPILTGPGVRIEKIEADMRAHRSLRRGNPWVLEKDRGRDRELSPRAMRAIDACCREARALSSETMAPEHLMLGILVEGGDAAQVLRSNGVTLEGARAAVRQAGRSGDAEEG